jgi:hypothetical protein
MSENELFDFKAAVPDLAPHDLAPGEVRSSPPPLPTTALKLDRWGLYQGETLKSENEAFSRMETLDSAAVADFFAAAFDYNPELNAESQDKQRHQFVQQLFNTADYQRLRYSTRLNLDAAEIAALSFCLGYSEFCKKVTPESVPTPTDDSGSPPSSPDPDDKRKGKKTKGSTPAKTPDPDPEIEMIKAVGESLKAASKEVGDHEEMKAAFGMGAGSGSKVHDKKRMAELFKKVRTSPSIRRICELAGRYRRIAAGKQRQKAFHGMDELVDITLGQELRLVLPSELVLLEDETLELEFYRKFSERSLMIREYGSKEPVGRGPLIVCIDESGSMGGEKNHHAKAIALALTWVATRQNRWTALIAYSGRSPETSPGYSRKLVIPPGKVNELELFEWLDGFLNGGSSRDVPILELPDYYHEIGAPVGKTDVVLLTDAICRLDESMTRAFNTWKTESQVKVATLIIHSEPGDLVKVSDEVHRVARLDVEEKGIEEILGV